MRRCRCSPSGAEAPVSNWSSRSAATVMSRADDRTGILLVEDHALVREGVRGILESEHDMVVVGEAGDSRTAVALASEKRPDVVLLDVDIPGEEAATTVGRIKKLSPAS